jgi:hypothetical protein
MYICIYVYMSNRCIYVYVRTASTASTVSLGAHLALIALTAFMSFGLALSLHLLEIELGMSLHWLSGVRMFKVRIVY